jgi:hypothetical protein
MWGLFFNFTKKRFEMKFFIAITFFFIQSVSTFAFHPTHISITSIEVDPDSLQINYSIRLFQDDIGYLIMALYHEELFHTADTFDFLHNTQKIEAYFIENIKMEVNGEYLYPVLKKKEINETEFWLYFSAKLENIPYSLTIENTVLLNLYRDQTNLVIFTYNKKEKGLTFDAKDIKQIIYLEK